MKGEWYVADFVLPSCQLSQQEVVGSKSVDVNWTVAQFEGTPAVLWLID